MAIGFFFRIEALLLVSDSSFKSSIDAQQVLAKVIASNAEWILFPLIEYFQMNSHWEIITQIQKYIRSITPEIIESSLKSREPSFTEYSLKTKKYYLNLLEVKTFLPMSAKVYFVMSFNLPHRKSSKNLITPMQFYRIFLRVNVLTILLK